MRKLIVLTGIAFTALIAAGVVAAMADQGDTMKKLLAAAPRNGPAVIPSGYEVPGPTWRDFSTNQAYQDTMTPKRILSDQWRRESSGIGAGTGGN